MPNYYEDFLIYNGEHYSVYFHADVKDSSDVNDYFESCDDVTQASLLFLVKRMADIGLIYDETKFRIEGRRITMKKSIFDKKMESSKFKAVYEEVSAKMGIGEQIAELRHKAKMSQLELAKKVHTSRTAIARYESGDYDRYTVGTLTRIARALRKRLKISFSS